MTRENVSHSWEFFQNFLFCLHKQLKSFLADYYAFKDSHSGGSLPFYFNEKTKTDIVLQSGNNL